MSLNDILPFDLFTSGLGGFELAGSAVRKTAATYDYYGNKDTFNAYVISKLVGNVTPDILATYAGTSVDIESIDL